MIPPTVKEVRLDTNPELLYVGVYTMREAAESLGKTVLGFKRWIKDGLIPAPILSDTVRGYAHYSEGEMEEIRKVLAVHEQEFTYFTAKHLGTIRRVWQAIQRYRSTGV